MDNLCAFKVQIEKIIDRVMKEEHSMDDIKRVMDVIMILVTSRYEGESDSKHDETTKEELDEELNIYI